MLEQLIQIVPDAVRTIAQSPAAHIAVEASQNFFNAAGVQATINSLVAHTHARSPSDMVWRLSNGVLCALLALRTGFPHVKPGRRISRRRAITRTFVAAWSAAVSASVFLGVYGLPFDVMLNGAYLLNAAAKGGDVSMPDELVEVPPRAPRRQWFRRSPS